VYIRREIYEASDEWRFQRSLNPSVASDIIATGRTNSEREPTFKPKTVLSKQNVEVRRRADFGAETVELDQTPQPAYLSPHSRITFRGTLNDFWQIIPPESQKLLVGLKVETLDTDSTATIEEIWHASETIHC